MKTNILFLGLISLCLFSSRPALGQEHRTLPYSFTHSVSTYVPTEHMPNVDHQALLQMESQEDKRGEFTFGKEFSVDFSTLNAGIWENLPNGDRLWRLGIQSDKAYSINLIFSYFYIPKGAKLHIYTADGSYITGCYGFQNNLPDRRFASSLLPGERIILEYWEPAEVAGQGALHLSSVIHGYKDFFFKGYYGGSDFCNIDIRCPEGDGFQDVKRSVCLILNGNQILCSGTLINNTRKDKIPYLLTAYHCVNGRDASNFVFIFNHEADSCGSKSSTSEYIVHGASLVAEGESSDFALLRLSSTPTILCHAYYAGWDRIDSAKPSAVCIHHPSGDVKKISLCSQPLEHSQGTNAFGPSEMTHWKVTKWNKGTTEKGSSGSGLFSPQKRLIGQLDGGTASCYDRDGYDIFGKIAYSWENEDSPYASARLREWLDPLQTGCLTLDGLDADFSPYRKDAGLYAITCPSGNLCERHLYPAVCWFNNGNDSIHRIDIHYQLDSSAIRSVSFNGAWEYSRIDTLVLDTLYDLPEGAHSLKIWTALPEDENSTNDTLFTKFKYHHGVSARWDIKTDYYPNQNHWVLKDAEGNTVAENPTGLHFVTNYRDTFCLPQGCYDFVIYDSEGDGLIGRDGNWQGYYYFYLQEKCLLSGIEFGERDSLHFCIDSTLSLPDLPAAGISENILLYPNPCSESLHIRISPMQQESHHLRLLSVDGRLLKEWDVQENTSDLSVEQLPAGIYLLMIQNEHQCICRKFVKN